MGSCLNSFQVRIEFLGYSNQVAEGHFQEEIPLNGFIYKLMYYCILILNFEWCIKTHTISRIDAFML